MSFYSWLSKPTYAERMRDEFERIAQTMRKANAGMDMAVKEIAKLRIENERLRALLYSALHHVAARGDTAQVTRIRHVLEEGDDQFT
jgi:hypothetical protein